MNRLGNETLGNESVSTWPEGEVEEANFGVRTFHKRSKPRG